MEIMGTEQLTFYILVRIGNVITDEEKTYGWLLRIPWTDYASNEKRKMETMENGLGEFETHLLY